MTRMRKSDVSKEYDPRSLSENLRDLDSWARLGVRIRLHTIKSYYTEPMPFTGFPVKPAAVLLGNVRAINSPEVAVADAGALVHFVWDQRGGGRITKIQGMTPNTDTQYEFTFLLIHKGSA